MKKILFCLFLLVNPLFAKEKISTDAKKDIIFDFDKKVIEIIIEAEKQHPNNYNMQRYQIKLQCEALKEISDLKNKVGA